MADSVESYRGTVFVGADFTGVVLRDCLVHGLSIVDARLADVTLSGGLDRVVVNDVDVTEYVQGELDRRFPERVQFRAMMTPDDYRSMWAVIERLWAETIGRARALPDGAVTERVGDEWSFSETLRHLVFATDAWAGSSICDLEAPYHSLGLPAAGYPPAAALRIGLDPDAQPSFDEVLAARAECVALVRTVLDGLDADAMGRGSGRPPAPEYPEGPYELAACLRVIMNEAIEHRRYAERDLAAIKDLGGPAG